jgi:hypothetical protein
MVHVTKPPPYPWLTHALQPELGDVLGVAVQVDPFKSKI